MAGHICTNTTKSSSLKCYLFFENICMQKIKDIDALLPEILMIKESRNLIGTFPIFGVCTGKYRTVMTCILGYFQPKLTTECYQKQKTNSILGPFRSFLPILGQTRTFWGNPLLLPFYFFRFILLGRI